MNVDEAKQRIEHELADLRNRVDKIDQDLRRERNTLEQDWKEQVTVRENDEVLEALSNEGSDRIVQLERALQRIATGVYGNCDACGERIAPERLEALPGANECVSCARAHEA